MSNEKHIVIFDGDCGFCLSAVKAVKNLDWLDKFEFVPFQNNEVLKKYNKLTKEMCEKEMFFIHPSGNYYGGYDAFKHMSVYVPVTFLISWFFFLPGVVQIGRSVYKIIAENRHKIKIGDSNKHCKIDRK